jgi:tRNA (guanine-N7-)-methyltransferase
MAARCRDTEISFYIIGIERVMGIEPTLSAWEAEVLPLNYTRKTWYFTQSFFIYHHFMLHTLRSVRSYVCRQGRLSDSQQRALTDLWDHYVLQNKLHDFDVLFGRAAPRILEIGFGMGQSLIHQAINHPEKDFIGIEVHRPGIAAVLLEIEKNQLSNIRIYCGDVKEILAQHFTDESLDEIQLFFPDPWPKRRHHKRRLVQNDFVNLVARKLKPNAFFYLATDWKDYAYQMLHVLSESTDFENTTGKNNFAPRANQRPLTKFELRGKRLGHEVWDLKFRRVPC